MRTTLTILALLAVFLAIPAGSGANAPPDDPDPIAAAALDLAKMTANEAGIHRWADALLIWQAAESHADDVIGRRRWLRAHSSCVLASDPDLTGRRNCRWTRELTADGARPASYPRHLLWHPERFLGLLEWCRRIVSDEVSARLCDSPPTTWDRLRHSPRAWAAGLRPVRCVDPATGAPTANAGWADPRVMRGSASGADRASSPPGP